MTTSNPQYQPQSPADVPALIAAYPLAWIVSRDFRATVLPMLAETDADGTLRSLLGHYALSNPQVASLREDPAALMLFQGPHGYVSPTLVSKPRWGPTWNYAVLRIQAEAEFVPEETDAALRRLAAHLEPERAWSVDQMEQRYAELLPRIVAFRAHVRAVEATFKLGQDEDEAVFGDIVARHVDPALAILMRHQRPGPAG